MYVRKMHPRRAKILILQNHYSLCVPQIIHSFGLFNDSEKLIGVVTFGNSPNNSFNKFPYPVLELNRLCLTENKKNYCSYLISKALTLLKMIEDPLIVVSYADPRMHHHGYIYQATNWIYTGLGSQSKVAIIDGKRVHSKTIDNRYKNRVLPIKKEELLWSVDEGKHRYFYVLSKSKKIRKDIRTFITEKFQVLPYPKGRNENYCIQKIKNYTSLLNQWGLILNKKNRG